MKMIKNIPPRLFLGYRGDQYGGDKLFLSLSLVHFMKGAHLLLALLLILSGLAGCRDESAPVAQPDAIAQKQPISSSKKTCAECHPYQLDESHNFSCQECHKGLSPADTKELAHGAMLSKPASPANMAAICGRCHESLTRHVAQSKHFTLADEINQTRTAFGASEELSDPQKIPQSAEPDTTLALADDMLRRRCLRCHPYSSGDDYQNVTHGQGCAACHLQFRKGALLSHVFIRTPGDQQCLSCHYSNYVGADYYGLFEHDYNWEYQTPFSPQNENTRPFGVPQHQLRPDIHQTAGLACIDCHDGGEIMATENSRISCLSCHDRKYMATTQINSPKNVSQTADGSSILVIKKGGKILSIPQMRKKSHPNIAQISCQVCHAQWSFSDYGTTLMRIDNDDYAPWIALTKQGSSEIEQILEYNLFYDNDSIAPYMKDKFTGAPQAGLWLKGFGLRRWEDVNTCLDSENILRVCRPLLDIHLSYVDADGEVIFDSVPPPALPDNLQPYAPHTIGKAGTNGKQRMSRKESLILDSPPPNPL